MLNTSQQGFAAIYITLVILAVMSVIGSSMFVTTFQEQGRIREQLRSSRAYEAAESGLEDALLRLNEEMNIPSSYTFSVADTTTRVDIVDALGGTKIISAEGDNVDRIRKAEAVYTLSGTSTSFFYGAQVGAGGLIMGNSSRVVGNLYSDGSIQADTNATVTGSVQVAGGGNNILDMEIGGDAYVDICNTSDIAGTLHATTETGCTYGAFVVLAAPVDSVPPAISDADITAWKADALAEGVVIVGNVELSGTDSASLGPVKIEGDLLLSSSADLTVTGTIWVTGNIVVSNIVEVRLSPSYGSGSGVIISDNFITLENNTTSAGSGQPGSYLMYLSTSSAMQALSVKNNAEVDIVHTSNGWVYIGNSAALREVSGFGIELENNIEITYETGLASALFTSGPSAGWVVVSWKEVE